MSSGTMDSHAASIRKLQALTQPQRKPFKNSFTVLKRALRSTRNWPNAGVRFGEVFARNLTIEPWLRMTGTEQADRKGLLPVSASYRPSNQNIVCPHLVKRGCPVWRNSRHKPDHRTLLRMTGVQEVDRKRLLPVTAHCGYSPPQP
jgi:hypothetical protein